MLRTAQSLPPTGLLTLGFDAGRFPPTPPACYRASWQLPGPDFHRQATTSLSPKDQLNTSPPVVWAHVGSGGGALPRGTDLLAWAIMDHQAGTNPMLDTGAGSHRCVSSARRLEPCKRFSRTRLTDVVHRRHSAYPRQDRKGLGATTIPLRSIRPS